MFLFMWVLCIFIGTPFEVTVIDSTNISFTGEGMRLAKVYKEVGLQMEHQGLDERDLDIKIVGMFCKVKD